MILLIAKTGIRFSEALGITPKDFDLNRQQLSINKTWNYKGEGGFLSTKNKSSIRKVQLDWQLVIQFSALIKDLPEDKPIFMIKDKLYNSTANGVLARHCSDKGIPPRNNSPRAKTPVYQAHDNYALHLQLPRRKRSPVVAYSLWGDLHPILPVCSS